MEWRQEHLGKASRQAVGYLVVVTSCHVTHSTQLPGRRPWQNCSWA
jgi:hypothetical protein